MVDAGRLPETLDYYRRVIEYCAEWKLNTLHFRLADDQGSALRFTSVPDLVIHKNAFAPEQLKALAEYAQTRGVDLIPELESFGHTGYITRSLQYAHLLDSEARGPSEFTGVIPVNPETLQLFDKLYREVAAIFPSIYLHGGCDEVNWGGSELSREALKTKTRATIWAEYLNSLHQICTALGKQLIVWGDFVVHKEPEILPQVNKNIIIMDWDYQERDSARLRETIRKVGAYGLRAIGAPALVNYRWGPRAGTEQLRNIEAFADAYLHEDDPNSLGVILTNWIPCRYVQNSIWDGFFYAAVAFNEGTAAAQGSGFRRFVENHYGATWNETWSEVFRAIYDAAPSVQKRPTASGPGLQLRVPWSDDAQLAAVLQIGYPIQNPFTRLRSLLVQLEPAVHKNLGDFQAFALSVEDLQRLFWRESVVIEEAAKKPLDRKSTDQLIVSIQESDRALAKALSKDWDKGRFPDSVAKSELVVGLQPKDQLLFEWVSAADYSTSLASHPERFHQLLVAAKPA
jgi:Glycosyl hydrolase family 20, catalytic domain